MNFLELVEDVRHRGKGNRRPVLIGAICKRCQISREHLWNLTRGHKRASRWMVGKLARGLRVNVEVVEAALAVTWGER